MSIVKPLLVLQEIDARIRARQQEARDIPLRKDKEQERLQGAQVKLAEAQASLKAARIRVDEAELEVSERRDKITRLRQQQLTLKTNREFQTMNLEIATIEGAIDTYEARQLAAMDGLTPAHARVAEGEKRLADEKAVVDVGLQSLSARLEAVQAELKQAEAERAQAAKNVPATHLLRYERLLGRRWPPVVPLEGSACGGCHLTQPPAVPHTVRRNTDLVVCGTCGRILHVP